MQLTERRYFATRAVASDRWSVFTVGVAIINEQLNPVLLPAFAGDSGCAENVLNATKRQAHGKLVVERATVRWWGVMGVTFR